MTIAHKPCIDRRGSNSGVVWLLPPREAGNLGSERDSNLTNKKSTSNLTAVAMLSGFKKSSENVPEKEQHSSENNVFIRIAHAKKERLCSNWTCTCLASIECARAAMIISRAQEVRIISGISDHQPRKMVKNKRFHQPSYKQSLDLRARSRNVVIRPSSRSHMVRSDQTNSPFRVAG